MVRKLGAAALAERGRRLARVVKAARRFAAACVAEDRPGNRAARERLLKAVVALDSGPGGARGRRVAPPR